MKNSNLIILLIILMILGVGLFLRINKIEISNMKTSILDSKSDLDTSKSGEVISNKSCKLEEE